MTDDRSGVFAVDDSVPSIDPAAFLAAGSTVIGAVQIAAGASVWYGAVLRADDDRISVGPDTNLQDGAIVHCDPGLPVVLGARVTVGHGAVVHGAVVEDDCLIGMRATLLNGVRLGAGSVVAAGAVVREGAAIPPGSLVAGVPASVRRATAETERTLITAACQEYLEKARRHKNTARRVSPS